MNNFEKPWYRSKKFLALLGLMTITSVLISAGIFVRVHPDVLQTMITILGGGTAASAGGYIGAQGYVDARVRPLLIEAETVVDEEVIDAPVES